MATILLLIRRPFLCFPPMAGQIAGVEFKQLRTHPDNRGFFREVLRKDDAFFSEFGQAAHAVLYDKVIKAWHYHREQTDYWYVVSGVMRVGLYDMREESPTYGQTMDFLMGDHQESSCLCIPPMVAHGCKALQGPVHIFYMMSHLYNPEDEGRRPYNDPAIPFDWLKDYEIS